MIISPVDVVPRVKVCILVVDKVPVPVRYEALFPEFADIVAVGVPELIFKTPNLAEEEVAPPRRRSSTDESFGEIVPLPTFQLDSPVEEDMQSVSSKQTLPVR